MLLGNMNVTWIHTSVFSEIFVLFLLKPVKILGNSLICSGLVFLKFVYQDESSIESRIDFSPLLSPNPSEHSYTMPLRFPSLAGGSRHCFWSWLSFNYWSL